MNPNPQTVSASTRRPRATTDETGRPVFPEGARGQARLGRRRRLRRRAAARVAQNHYAPERRRNSPKSGTVWAISPCAGLKTIPLRMRAPRGGRRLVRRPRPPRLGALARSQVRPVPRRVRAAGVVPWRSQVPPGRAAVIAGRTGLRQELRREAIAFEMARVRIGRPASLYFTNAIRSALPRAPRDLRPLRTLPLQPLQPFNPLTLSPPRSRKRENGVDFEAWQC